MSSFALAGGRVSRETDGRPESGTDELYGVGRKDLSAVVVSLKKRKFNENSCVLRMFVIQLFYPNSRGDCDVRNRDPGNRSDFG